MMPEERVAGGFEARDLMYWGVIIAVTIGLLGSVSVTYAPRESSAVNSMIPSSSFTVMTGAVVS